MNLHPGTFLKSVSAINDPLFTDALVFINTYNADGATGFIINQLFPRKLNELAEFSYAVDFPLCDGGPVGKEFLYFIHQRRNLIADGAHICNNIYFGGNFKQAVAHINSGQITQHDIKIFTGYCGWDNGQLEEEIKEGGWLIIEEDIITVFGNPV